MWDPWLHQNTLPAGIVIWPVCLPRLIFSCFLFLFAFFGNPINFVALHLNPSPFPPSNEITGLIQSLQGGCHVGAFSSAAKSHSTPPQEDPQSASVGHHGLFPVGQVITGQHQTPPGFFGPYTGPCRGLGRPLGEVPWQQYLYVCHLAKQ